MTGKTHVTAGMAIGLVFSIATAAPVGMAAPMVLASALGSLIPDIDTATSKLGQKVAPVSWLIRLLFGHRQMFHSLTFWMIIAATLLIFRPDFLTSVVTGYAGILTHLLLDSFNPSGVPFIWPCTKRFSFGSLQCGGIIDRILTMMFSIATVILLVHYAAQHM